MESLSHDRVLEQDTLDTDSEDEFSEEEEYGMTQLYSVHPSFSPTTYLLDLDDYEALNPAPLTDKIHNWQRTTEAI